MSRTDRVRLCTPIGFGQVSEGVYRSAYPANSTLPFLKTLHLHTLIALQPRDIRDDLRIFCQEEGIRIVEADFGVNQEPFVTISEEVGT